MEGMNETDRINYHPAIVGPNDVWKGKTWKDMPGGTSPDCVIKKLNFFLYRRGLHSGRPAEFDLAIKMERMREAKKQLKLCKNQSIAHS